MNVQLKYFNLPKHYNKTQTPISSPLVNNVHDVDKYMPF